MGTLKRAKLTTNFTTVGNDFIRDETISWKAKGIIIYIMSLPENWKINTLDLQNRSAGGRKVLMSGINELIEHGYIQRSVTRENGIITDWEYTVWDSPVFTNDENNDEIESEQPLSQKGLVENRSLLIKTNKEINTNIFIKEEKEFPTDLFPESSPTKKTLFRNCILNDQEIFNKKFNQPEMENVDLSFYYHSVKDWSDSANKKRTSAGWLATARSFMRNDMRSGKLKVLQAECKKNSEQSHKDMMDFLNM